MRENLINELKNLAQEILLLKEGNEVDALRAKTLKIFEELSVLDYLNKNSFNEIDTIDKNTNDDLLPMDISIDDDQNESNTEIEKEEELFKVDLGELNSTIKKETENNENLNEPTSLADMFVPTFDLIKEDMSQKEEFKDTISLDETEKLFKAKRPEPRQLSLNDKLLGNNMQIGLNDRIAFVNKLFNFNQSEFNKVLQSLNEFNNKQEAINFIQNTVKPKYNWKGQEELEERLILIIERKFL